MNNLNNGAKKSYRVDEGYLSQDFSFRGRSLPLYIHISHACGYMEEIALYARIYLHSNISFLAPQHRGINSAPSSPSIHWIKVIPHPESQACLYSVHKRYIIRPHSFPPPKIPFHPRSISTRAARVEPSIARVSTYLKRQDEKHPCVLHIKVYSCAGEPPKK